MNNKFEILYKRTHTGAIQQWEIVVEDNTFYTVEGQVNGKQTTSKPTLCEAKNEYKANATTSQFQAYKEAQARWKKQTEKGYTPDIRKIDTAKKFFEPMLAKKYLDYKDDIEFPVLVSRKIDGSRLVAKADGLWTRNGKQYVSCPHIAKILQPLFDKHPDWVVDGEIYSHEVPFEKIMSLVRKSKPTDEDIAESEKIVQYYIFDGVTDNVDADFTDRFTAIRKEIDNLIGRNKSLVFVETEGAFKHDEVISLHDMYVKEGFEGAMVRITRQPYENKRSKYLLKYKKFFDEEFEIQDVEEGIGNRSGMAGRLVMKMKDGRTFGSNMRGGEEYYKELLKNRKKLIGKKATIRYQELSQDDIPRFPVAVNIDPVDR